MADHYSDYLKKAVSVSDLVFDKVQESDKEVIKKIRKDHIKSNMVYIILLAIACLACLWYFVNFCFLPVDSIVYEVISLGAFGAAIIITGSIIIGYFRGIKEIRRGVCLASSREQENKEKGRQYDRCHDPDLIPRYGRETAHRPVMQVNDIRIIRKGDHKIRYG